MSDQIAENAKVEPPQASPDTVQRAGVTAPTVSALGGHGASIAKPRTPAPAQADTSAEAASVAASLAASAEVSPPVPASTDRPTGWEQPAPLTWSSQPQRPAVDDRPTAIAAFLPDEPPATVVPDIAPTPVAAEPLAVAPAPAAVDVAVETPTTIEGPAPQLSDIQSERDKKLGTVRSEGTDDTVPPPPAKHPNDKFLGSAGLFLLRLVTSILVGVYGFQLITDRQPAIDGFNQLKVPQADLWSWVLAALLLLLSVTLLFGFLTRASGLVLAILAILVLVFFRWGNFNPFFEGQLGFSGQLEFLLAGIGLLFLCIGSGGWAIDGGIRQSKLKKKLDATW